MPSRGARYRRSPYLISYWKDGRFVLQNYASDARVAASGPIVDLLDMLGEWRTAASLSREPPGHDAEFLAETLERLHALTLVERSDCRPSRRDIALNAWGQWSPEAAFFHLSTKNPVYSNPAAGEAALREKAKRHPRPSPIKRLRGADTISLPPPDVEGDLGSTLARRRTWRRFGDQPLALGDVATLLGLTFGVHRWSTTIGQGVLALKRAPSGGSRHNLEAYALVLNAREIGRGFYHYDANSHALRRVGAADGISVTRYLPGQTWYEDAALVVFMSAVFGRAQWRYSYPRAYRSVFLEAGHFCQNFLLLATALGLAPFCTGALADASIEADLRIDGVSESVVYACGVGARPPGVEWAPWPNTDETPRLIPPVSARKRRKS